MSQKPKKRIWKILRWIVFSFLFLFGVALVLPFIFEKEVKQFALEQINANVKADVKVDNINLSFIKRFPDVSLQFNNVRIANQSAAKDSTDLLSAKDILIKFSIWDILGKNYAFEKIEFVDLVFNPSIDANGEVNYDIFYEQEEKDSARFFVDLKHVQLSNSIIKYQNALTNIVIHAQINELIGKVQVDEQYLNLALQSDILMREWSETGVYLMRNKSIQTDIESRYILANSSFEISKGDLSYQNFGLRLSGKATDIETTPTLDFRLQLAALNLEDLVKELPSEQRKELNSYKVKGKFETQMHIHGGVDKHHLPIIEAQFKLHNGHATLKKENILFRDIQLVGNFTNGHKQSVSTSELKLTDLSFHTQAGHFKGELFVNNFKDPNIKLNANTQIELAAVNAFIPDGMIEEAQGKLNLNLRTRLKVSNWQDSTSRMFDLTKLSGDMVLDSAEIRLPNDDRTYQNIFGELAFTKNKIKVRELHIDINEQHLALSGSVKKLEALLNPFSREKLLVQLKAHSPSLNLDKLVSAAPQKKETTPIEIPEKYDVYLDFKVDTFSWNPYLAHNVSGSLSLIDGDVSINPLQLDALEGKFKGTAQFTQGSNDLNILQAKGKVSNMNISKVFATFNNFDQEVLTNKNINGSVTSDFDVHILQDKKGRWIEESISCAAHIEVENGELIDVKELNALKSFTRIDDFSHIKFRKLENDIQINNAQILIPEMDIQSDKMNIKLFGKHNFSNAYEYHFEINLNELLARKVKEKQTTEFGEIQNDKPGRMTLYLMVVGQGEEFEVKLDRKKTSKEIRKEIKQEGVEVKEALKQEFGPKDTPQSIKRQEKRKKKAEEKELLKKQEEGKVVIEWEEF